jgi:hypothetical protein
MIFLNIFDIFFHVESEYDVGFCLSVAVFAEERSKLTTIAKNKSSN